MQICATHLIDLRQEGIPFLEFSINFSINFGVYFSISGSMDRTLTIDFGLSMPEIASKEALLAAITTVTVTMNMTMTMLRAHIGILF